MTSLTQPAQEAWLLGAFKIIIVLICVRFFCFYTNTHRPGTVTQEAKRSSLENVLQKNVWLCWEMAKQCLKKKRAYTAWQRDWMRIITTVLFSVHSEKKTTPRMRNSDASGASSWDELWLSLQHILDLESKLTYLHTCIFYR